MIVLRFLPKRYTRHRLCRKFVIEFAVCLLTVTLLILWLVSYYPRVLREQWFVTQSGVLPLFKGSRELPYSQFRAPPPELAAQRRPRDVAPRLALLTVATEVSEMVCTHLGSALLSGVSPVIVGYNRSFRFHHKFAYAIEAVSVLGLNDWDTVLLLDSDTTFTGQDVTLLMEEFTRHSPEHPDDIDVRATRSGEQWAPLTFHSEPNCYAPREFKYVLCPEQYRRAFAAVDEALRTPASHQWISRPAYLNSGVAVARVWALREFQRALELHVASVPSRVYRDCDQSVATGLYLDQLWSEVSLGLLHDDDAGAMTMQETGKPAVNQFGLHYGAIGLDMDAKLAAALSKNRFAKITVNGEQYGVRVSSPISEFPFERERLFSLSSTILHHLDRTPFVKRRVLHHHHGGANVSVRVAPSLLTRPYEGIDLSHDRASAGLHFPLLIHTPGGNKLDHHHRIIPLTGWGLALRSEAGYLSEAKNLIETAAITAVADGRLHSLRMKSLCGYSLDSFFSSAVVEAHTHADKQ